MKDRLVFDTTDANTIADSDSVGAYVRAGDDGTLIGHVSDALKVNMTNASIVVTATDLDIRDLAFATDSVTAYQGTDPWVIGDGGGSITVDGSVTVSATDLDIRDLSHTQDSIKIGDGTDFLAINADGSINVNADISVVNGHEKAEDSAHVSGDIGSYMLAVRQDTLANSVSADGDYASLKVDAQGALYVNLTNTISINDAALANTSIANAAETLDVASTSQDIIVSPLSNRKYLWVYNKDNQVMYIGSAGVTSANGFPISPSSYMELRAGAAVDIEFVSAKLGHEIRTLELS